MSSRIGFSLREQSQENIFTRTNAYELGSCDWALTSSHHENLWPPKANIARRKVYAWWCHDLPFHVSTCEIDWEHWFETFLTWCSCYVIGWWFLLVSSFAQAKRYLHQVQAKHDAWSARLPCWYCPDLTIGSRPHRSFMPAPRQHKAKLKRTPTWRPAIEARPATSSGSSTTRLKHLPSHVGALIAYTWVISRPKPTYLVTQHRY